MMILNEENYEPNITCPFCHAGCSTTPDQELEWGGWQLAVKQTCPTCDAQWVERWELKSVEPIE